MEIEVGVLSEADNTLRDLHSSLDHTKAESNNSFFQNKLKHAFPH